MQPLKEPTYATYASSKFLGSVRTTPDTIRIQQVDGRAGSIHQGTSLSAYGRMSVLSQSGGHFVEAGLMLL